MFFCLNWRTHLFREKSTKSCAIRIINGDILAPFAHMVRRSFGHTTCKPRHQPRISVLDFIVMNLTIVETVIAFGQGVFEVMASTKGLDAQNVVQMEALVTGDGFRGKEKESKIRRQYEHSKSSSKMKSRPQLYHLNHSYNSPVGMVKIRLGRGSRACYSLTRQCF